MPTGKKWKQGKENGRTMKRELTCLVHFPLLPGLFLVLFGSGLADDAERDDFDGQVRDDGLK